MRTKLKGALQRAARRAVKSPKTTGAGLAALIALIAPHYDSTRLLAAVVFLLGLLSEDAKGGESTNG